MKDGKLNIALFGSFYRGYYMLDEILNGPLKSHFTLVGVVTDDVNQSFISREKRVWQYPHHQDEETMVEEKAKKHNLPVYKGRVKTDFFYNILENEWGPDLCISATFGQRIDARIFEYPRYGFYNLHPCIDDGWPSKYAGPNPFHELKKDGHHYTTAALHRVDGDFDTGELMAMSPRIAIPPQATVVDMHKITSPGIAKFAVPELLRIVNKFSIEKPNFMDAR